MSYGSKIGAGSVPKHPALPPNETPKYERFAVTVIFSPISKNEFASWTQDRYYNASQPFMLDQPYSYLAWETSKYGYQGNPKETIFVDCNAHYVDEFDSSAAGDFELRPLLSFAVEELKAIIYRKALEGIFGDCDLNICAYHPCEKLMFALAKLLKQPLPETGVYSAFCNFIEGQEEYQNAFRWIQSKYHWKINVLYGGIFEAYRLEVKDSGAEESGKRMEKELDEVPSKGWFESDGEYYARCRKWAEEKPGRKLENGKPMLKHGDDYITPKQYEREMEKMTDPSTDDIRHAANQMQDALNDDIKNRLNPRKAELDKKITQVQGQKRSWPDNPDRKFFDRMRGEEIEYIEKSNPDMSERHKKELAYQRHHEDGVVAFDGKYMREYDLTQEQQKIEQEIAERQEEIDKMREMADKIDDAFWKSVIQSGISIMLAIGSCFCPLLAIVDIALSVYFFADGINEATVGDAALTGVGIGMDILGLVPYVGGLFKVGAIATKMGKIAAASAKAAKGGSAVVALKQSTEQSLKLGAKAKALGVLKDKMMPYLKYTKDEIVKGWKEGTLRPLITDPKKLKKGWAEAGAGAANKTEYIATNVVTDTWTKFWAIGYQGGLWLKDAKDYAMNTVDADDMTLPEGDIDLNAMSKEQLDGMKNEIAGVLGCDPNDITMDDLSSFINDDDMSSLLLKANPDKGVQEEKKSYTKDELQDIYAKAEEDSQFQDQEISRLEEELEKKGGSDPYIEAQLASAKQQKKDDEFRMNAAQTAMESQQVMDEHEQKEQEFQDAKQAIVESRWKQQDLENERDENREKANKLKEQSTDDAWNGDMESSDEKWAKGKDYDAIADDLNMQAYQEKKRREGLVADMHEAAEAAHGDEERWNQYGAEIDNMYAIDDLNNGHAPNNAAQEERERKEDKYNKSKEAVQESQRKQGDIIDERDENGRKARELRQKAVEADWNGDTETADELTRQAKEYEAAVDKNNEQLQKQREEHGRLVQQMKDDYNDAYNTIPTSGTAADRYQATMQQLNKVDEQLRGLGEHYDQSVDNLESAHKKDREIRDEGYDDNSWERKSSWVNITQASDDKIDTGNKIRDAKKEREKIVEQAKAAYREAYGEEPPAGYFDYDTSHTDNKHL